MKNCIKTTYKCIFENQDLPKLGVLEIGVEKASSISNAGQQQSLLFATDDEITVSVTGIGYFALAAADFSDETKRLTSLTITSSDGNKTLYFANENYTIEVANKYHLTRLSVNTYTTYKPIFSMNLGNLVHLDKLVYLNLRKTNTRGSLSGISNLPVLEELFINNNASMLATGNISSLSEINTLTSLTLGQSPFTGDIESLANLTALTFLDINTTQIGGNIANLGKMTSLSTLLIKSSAISGSIEQFVEAQCQNGRTSTSQPIAANTILSQIPFGTYMRTDSSGSWIEWTSANKIIVKVGNTYDGATVIYAKGATAEEIAAWEQAGKTVYIVE